MLKSNKGLLVSACLLIALLVISVFPVNSIAADEKPTLNFITGTWTTEVLDEYFDKFEEETGIKIKTEAYPFAELFETIQIRHRSESKDVDVILVDAPVTAAYATKGVIKPLDDYFSEEEVNSTWAPNCVKAGEYNDHFYSAPLNNSSQVLYYNKDLLEEAGVEFPSADVDKRWTWDQVVEAAKKVDALGEGTWGFAFDQINRYYQLQVLPESLGGGPGITENHELSLTSEKWLKAFNFYYDLFNKWEISPKGVSPAECPEWFSAGKIGFFVGGLWNITTFNEGEVDYAVAPHPYFEEGKPVTPTLSWHVGMWKYTEHEEAAAKFIKYLTTTEEIGKFWLKNWGQFPARNSVLQYIEESGNYSEQPLIAYEIAKYEVNNTAVNRPQTPAYLEFERRLNSAFENIRNGVKPEKAFEREKRKLKRLLRRYR